METYRGVQERIQGAPVKVVDLAKYYGEVRAVDGVSLDIRAGEFLALLGPSGSGKTTILMTIAGFEQPTRGQVLIGSRSVTHVPPNKRDLGMVFQKYALFPHMTVFENVAYPLRMRKVPFKEISARVEAVLSMVRLGGYASRMPNQLSGGEQQRIALARAIVYSPPVLLMDEPLGALDKKLREQMQLEIKHLQKKLGATVIYVTHDQEEALTMADRIAVLHRGTLQQIGTPEELYEQPANSFVADFIGETNFVEGTLLRKIGNSCQIALDGGVTIQARAYDSSEDVLQEGSVVRVAVRPEQVRLSLPAGEDRSGYPGTVQETIYAGASVACVVRLGSKVSLTVRVPTGSGKPRWRPGDAVRVSWEEEDARVYESSL